MFAQVICISAFRAPLDSQFICPRFATRCRRSARQLVEAAERNVAFVGRARDSVEFSPKDLTQVAGFLAKESAAKQVSGIAA